MSILLSDRQADDLYAPTHRPVLPCCSISDIDQLRPRHKAILDYLHNAGFTKSFEQLKQDTKLVRPTSFLTGVDVPMHCIIVGGLPARSRAEEQWPPRKEVDERDPDAKEGAFLSSDHSLDHTLIRRRRR